MTAPERVPVVADDLEALLDHVAYGNQVDQALLNRMTADYTQQRAIQKATLTTPPDLHWNSASRLPLVDVKLMIQLSPGTYAVCQRNEWSKTKDPDTLKYVLESGVEIVGKFPWTYL